MTRVSLEAARRLVIPETNCTVMRGGKDIFGIRRELNVLAYGVVSLCQSLETLAGCRVPYATEYDPNEIGGGSECGIRLT